MVKYHFIAGLPRAGSTLLAGILRQNPRFHAAMSSPVLGLTTGALEYMGASGEFYTSFDATKRKQICIGLFDSYYSDMTDKEVIFDTNRMWAARLHLLMDMFPDSKLICCVRNPAWVMDSFESIYRKNPFDYSQLYTPQTRQTVYSRCEAMASSAGVLGSAWSALKEAYYSDFSDRLLLIDYDLLAQKPQQCIQLLYQFIDEPLYQHDFDNVEYSDGEFDLNLGVKGLHDVKRVVSFKPRRTILPPELFQQYSEMAFWQDSSGTNASIIKPQKAT
ncbi:sulfotransferase family protein [Vibrio agarilyticus]|uniref:sulfotransferase family protein n=1 Tax=Vibrio agarilyticus TaxID=2726741 RepID=UPI001B3B2C0B|nr:sulfotransferase [Vibrio agarilyticus]